MPWQPTRQVAYAICTQPFRPTDPEDLVLEIGDSLYIFEQGGDRNEWCRGFLVSPKSLRSTLDDDIEQLNQPRVFTGIFPRNCVEVREYVEDSWAGAGAVDSRKKVNGEDLEQRGEPTAGKAPSVHRLSRARRRQSQQSVGRKDHIPLVDVTEYNPRDPAAPKPLAPVPLLRVGDELGRAVDEPLVDEIASCLREWHDARLNDLLLHKGYDQLARINELVKRVDRNRKQLLHDVLTTKELVTLREDTVWDLVSGNKMLDDDVVVRSPADRGRLLTADDSVVEMTKLQTNMSILDRPPKTLPEFGSHYHIFVDVRNIVCNFAEPAMLQVYLCTKDYGKKPRPISEVYAIPVPLDEADDQNDATKNKTLFVSLSGTDVGVGAKSRQLYLIFKLLKDEPTRHPLSNQAEQSLGHQRNISQSTTASVQDPQAKTSGQKGRRSLFGGSRKNSIADSTARPDTSLSRQSEDDDSTIFPEPQPNGVTKYVKRTLCLGAIELSKLAQQQSELETSVTMWSSVRSLASDDSRDSEDWSEIVRELLPSKADRYDRSKLFQRFDIYASAFASSDVDTLIRSSPTLLHGVHRTQKLGFSSAPTQPRSDIYLTLTEPLVEHNAALQHSKYGNIPLSQRFPTGLANLQLTLEIRKANGERIEECIFAASNHGGHTAWRTTGVERGESWNQTVKLVVPSEDVPGCHVVMSIADAPNFPFALAWIPLWEHDAFVRDGDHRVALYVYDEYSSSIIGGKGAYLALPPWHDQKHEPAYGTSATLSLRTYLCSTEYSQDRNLLGLLKWRDFQGEKLLELLNRFSSVPEIEVVKLLPEIFNALFEVLHEYADTEAYEDIVFYNLVLIMELARDKRFNIEDVVEQHAKSRHDWPNVSRCLLKAFQRLLSNPMDAEVSRRLRATVKVGDQMLKLIVETSKASVQMSPTITAVNGDNEAEDRYPEMLEDLQKLFVTVMALMRNPMTLLLGTQTLVVQHFHSWLAELAPKMTAASILEFATDLLDACAHAEGTLVFHRLVLIIKYSQLEIFKDPSVRTALVANTFRWLAPYWGETQTVNAQWHDQVRLCCSVVATQMEELGEESCQYVPKLVASYSVLAKTKRKPKANFSMLFPTSYPFPYKAASDDFTVDEAMLEIVAVLAAALNTPQRLYFDANQVDVPGVLLQTLKVYQSILSGGAFPERWLSLYVSHHRFAVSAMERIFEVLVDSLPDSDALSMEDAIDFDTELWRVFFATLFATVSSPALAMESFPEQKRRATWKIAGDVRELGADLIRRSWNAIGWETEQESRDLHGFERMGGYQVQFVPELVQPIVAMCLSVHASLRSVATDVLRAMIISSWEIDQDLSHIQSAVIECLDTMCRTKQVTELVLQATFVEEMIEQFSRLQHTVEDSLYTAVKEMFGRIEDLLTMLANVHQGDSISEATRIVETLKLMTFLKDVQSEEAFIRYVHQLVDLQTQAGNHAEAGLALRMHADRYEWDPAKHLEPLTEPKYSAQTAFERKEALFFEMCSAFEKAKSWHAALDAYRELAQQYESNVFDFSKLARSQRAMAAIHEKIVKGGSAIPRYFHVAFRGLGFQASLKDRDFIFEASSEDRQVNFEERLLSYYPTARIARTPLGKTDDDVEGQHLHVSPVAPNRNIEHTVYQRSGIPTAAREYALMANPRMFSTTSRKPQPGVPILEQEVAKTVYKTAEAFPTILRRSEILSTAVTVLTPLQAAVERTSRKTQELLAAIKTVATDDSRRTMENLGDLLLLAVDPAAEGGISQYRTLLPSTEQADRGSAEIDYDMLIDAEPPAMSPMQNALKVALLDHASAIKRGLRAYDDDGRQVTKAMLLPRFEATFEREIAILFPQKQDLADETSRRSSLQSRDPAVNLTYPNGTDPSTSAGGPLENGIDPASSEDHQRGETRRSSRRRSIPFLRRSPSTASTKQDAAIAPDTSSDIDDGRTSRSSSRTRTRSRSRSRAESITRRLSFFRDRSEDRPSSSQGDFRSGSAASQRSEVDESGTPGGITLKKRLSFLKATSHSGLNARASGTY